jgi:hypothetical protein
MRHQDRKKISDALLASGWVRGNGRSFEQRNTWRRNGYLVFVDARIITVETDEKYSDDRKTIVVLGPYSGIGWTQKTADAINQIVDAPPKNQTETP